MIQSMRERAALAEKIFLIYLADPNDRTPADLMVKGSFALADKFIAESEIPPATKP